MTFYDRFDRFEREIPALMDDLAPRHLPDYFDDMLLATARTRQRPAWSDLERWLPMGVIAQTRTITSVPWRPILVVGLIALLAAATVLVVGSQQRRLPAPFGPARNGAIVFATFDGDIVSADPGSGAVTTIIAGEDVGFDSAPWFANDGTKFAFDRFPVRNAAQRSLAISTADGSEVRELVGPSAEIRSFDWSPTGDQMVVLRDRDPLGQVTLVDAETGAPTTFTVDFPVMAATFRPESDELILTGAEAAYVIGVDGTGLRTLLEDPAWLDQYSISPDGSLLAYATWSDGAEGRIHVVDIDSGVERPIDFDPGFAYTDLTPAFMPDGEALLVERYDATGYRPTIVPLDGGSPIAFGEPHPEMTDGSARTISPDGEQLLVTYQDDGTTWLFDVATGEGTLLEWGPAKGTTATWQRLAP